MDARFDGLKFGPDGLLPVVVQSRLDGALRMVAWADREALEETLARGVGCFYSRSRGRLWRKGESSGNVLYVREIWVDCDSDTLVYRVDPAGPSCHTGAPSCFFRRLDAPGEGVDAEAADAVASLERVLRARRDAPDGAPSYTRSLLAGGAPRIGAKVTEEAEEFVRALRDEGDARVVSEAADLVFHVMVGLVSRGLGWQAVQTALAGRAGVSGLVEKASRGAPEGP
ncbi:MAG: bifunctional phosphoribosyl-AMP cyclohydrolase/phosphoribosyl-ATP diphosphatase HisIE [Myxococcales bacterium]|nr:bifunctional phosphoribosyl-AMP cyclohydrolase/phosphoribosyl-ATP diphosphatase HisIE [Myxococcales bacterium]